MKDMIANASMVPLTAQIMPTNDTENERGVSQTVQAGATFHEE